jgi:glutamate formiminotransferase / 5-formyltetrahydrofolate cyclo-ligase
VTLECVVNVSAGADDEHLALIATAAGKALLDRHSDALHNRSVLTLAAEKAVLLDAVRALATKALELLDLVEHAGVHPRLGVVDVVPFAPLGRPPFDLTEAIAARDEFAAFAATALGLPCFLYGPERSLPEIRRRALVDLPPDLGPPLPDPHRGVCCVGARAPLVAYNLVLAAPDLDLARRIARELRSPFVRALGFSYGDEVQVSCNLVEPFDLGPAELVDACRESAPVARTELVGLIPAGVLEKIPRARWRELDLSEAVTIEGRLGRPGD